MSKVQETLEKLKESRLGKRQGDVKHMDDLLPVAAPVYSLSLRVLREKQSFHPQRPRPSVGGRYVHIVCPHPS